MTGAPKFISEKLDDAIRWRTRLTSGGEDERDWQEFTRWLEASPENRKAYDYVDEISSSIDRLVSAGAAAEESLRAPIYNKPRSALRSPVLWFGSAVALAAALLLVVALPQQQSREAEYSTRVGERRSVHLGDGSELDLNTATTLRTAIDSSRRRVVLVRGEALFHVAKNPALPFEVLMGQQRVRVLGTVFDVLRTDSQLRVTVAEGRVLFSKATPGKRVLLLSGDQLVYRPDAGTRISHVPAGTVSAWRNGYLVYENATLADITDDLNRYFKRKVIVGDGPTARQKFSGILRMDREEAVLNRLSHLLPIRTEYEHGNLVLLRSSAAKD
jgi:transmembrane sensor